MTKKCGSDTNKRLPSWQTRWPKTNDLRQWLLCGIQKCESFDDPNNGCSQAQLPIGGLARSGYPEEALKYVDRFLKRLPKGKALETVQMARLGAEICLATDDLLQMERYLAIATATEKYNTRKCDVGFSINSVRKFRILHGILDPADAIDESERREAIYKASRRRFRQQVAQNDLAKAKAELAVIVQFATQTKDEWECYWMRHDVVSAYGAVGDVKGLKRFIRDELNNEGSDFYLYSILHEVGLEKEAIAEARKEIRRQINELKTMDDPNIHFPIQLICDALKFLVAQQKLRDAKRFLREVTQSTASWPSVPQGWTTSAAFSMFAEVVALIDGPEQTQELIDKAKHDAGTEKRADFRLGAITQAFDVETRDADLDAAIAAARKLCSPKMRREKLAKLLIRGKRWRELKEVCSGVSSPEEAFELCWSIKFTLPGGEPR